MKRLMNMQLPENMGQADRLIRGGLGAWMLLRGDSMVGKVVGGAFLFYGLTGFDPLLELFEVNTKPGDRRNVANRMKPVMDKAKPMVEKARTRMTSGAPA